MTSKSRYHWLVADNKRVGMIVMDETRDWRGRLLFQLPVEFRDYMMLQGIEMPAATCSEAMEWFAKRLAEREKQVPGSVMPEDCCDWMAADIQARSENNARSI